MPRTIKDIYPLSPVQQGLLFHTLSAPDSGVYFEQFSVRLEGSLNAEAFRGAWERLVHRHDVLRSAVQWEGLDTPVLVVFDRIELPWSEEDWRGLDQAEQATRLSETLAAERVEGFDLGRAPLLRVGLYRLADDAWQVVWNYHHLLLDGWSSAAVLRELFLIYVALCAGDEPRLPNVRQYRDYIGWLQQQDLGAAERFWRDLLAGVTEPTVLGVDRPADGFRGDDDYDRRELVLPASLSTRLDEVARQRRLTVNTIFQAAWSLLLSRYSGSDDVVFGVTSSGRPVELPGVEEIAGMFINTLPARVKIPRERTIADWLPEFQREETERRQFEFSPLAKVQDWSEVPSGGTLFESILVFENYPTDFSVLDEVRDLRVTELFGIEQTNYPLTLLIELGAQTKLKVWFDETRIDADVAERLLGHLRTLIEELIGDPERPVAGIGLLTEPERRQLDQWADTGVDFGAPECLHDLVVRQAAKTPDAIAVRCEGEELTYAELDRQSNQLAHHLIGQGVTVDRVVGLCLHRSTELVVAMLGVLKAGGAYLPLDPDHPVDRLEFMLRDTGAALVLTQEHLRAGLPDAVPVLVMDREWYGSHPEVAPGPRSTATDLAYVMYTSGSTGNPKGVMVEHAGVWNRLRWGQHHYDLDASAVVLQKTPYTFDVSVWEFFWPLMVGAKLVLARPEGHKDPDYLVRLVRDEAITVLHFVPSMLRYFLVADGVSELPSVERVFCSGEALTAELRDRFFELFDAELHNLFGPTEASIEVTYWQCLPEHAGDPVVPIGRPIANVHCRILDQAGQQVPVGVPGELCLGGVAVARGYLGRPELTAEKFIDDPFAEGRLYRTGDLARRRADGVIEFLGRNDDQVKIRGQRVEPGEIESVILTHPAVREAAVTVHEVEGQQQLAAYVVPAVDADEVRDWVRQRLPEYMVPAGVTMLDRLPLSSNGKLDRGALPEPVWQGGEEFIPARSSLEQELAAIWAEVLGVERVGVLDNFFALGGDSILSIQMVSRAAQAGIHLTPAQVFREQTVARLVEVAGHGPAVLAPQEPVTGPVELGPIQRWFFDLDLPVRDQWNQGVTLRSRTEFDPERVRSALERVLVQHDVLRSRFTGGAACQVGIDEIDVPVVVSDDPVRAAHTGLDIEHGPLLKAAVDGTTLVLACHHLVVDAVSWRFIVEDFERAYLGSSGVRGSSPEQTTQQGEFPPKTTAFAQWTERLASYDVSAEENYWRGVVDTITPLPIDYEGPDTQETAVTRRISLPAEATARLAETARRMKARVDELVLTACAQGLTDWTGDAGITVDVEGHGREQLFDDIDLSRTVGWFTVMRPVHLPVGAAQEVDAVRAVKHALREAPNNGLGYGLLRDRLPGNPAVLFNFLGQLDGVSGGEFTLALDDSAGAHAPSNTRHHPVEINAAVHEGALTLELTYPGACYEQSTVDILLAEIRGHLDALTVTAGESAARAYLPGDFPLARIGAGELARITATHGLVGDLYPATTMQQGLLFHTLSAPGSGVYFEQFSVRLEGELDPAAFRESWQRLVDRHEALRSAVEWEGLDRPLMVVFDSIELPWSEEDWRDLDASKQAERLSALLAKQREDGFELNRAPLLRVGLFRLEDEAWQVVWNFHHLLLDGWSSAGVLRELFEIYVPLCDGRTPELPPVRQYHDYIEWLQKQDLEAAERYWRELLAGVSEPTALGVDRPSEGERRDEDYDRREIVLPAALGSKLEEVARRRRLTVNTLFQAAWSLLLSRYSGTEDVVFGVTSSGRPVDLAGAEHIAGLFINTLPARVTCPAGERLGTWLSELQQAQIDQRQFEFSPLTKVQEWSEVPAGVPLFESILVFENYPADFSVLERVSRLRVADLHSMEQTNYPLTVVIIPGPETTLKVWFDQTRIDAGAAERLLGHLRGLLEELAGDETRAVGEIGLLTAPEAELFERWADTGVDYGEPECLHQVIARQAAATPDAIAVRCGQSELTYAELDRRANQLAHHLIGQGVRADKVVGVAMRRSVELVVALLGVLKAGGAYVPLDPEYPAERLEFLVRDTGAKLVLTQDDLRDRLPGPVLALDVAELDGPETDPGVGKPADLAYVIYTSGSTGRPKGVMLEHRGVWNRLRWMQAEYPIGAADVVLQKTPYTFDVSVWEFFWPLMTGARMVLAKPDGHRDPAYLTELIRDEGVTTLHFVPSMLRYFLAAERVSDLPSVKRVFCSGEALTADLRDRFFELFGTSGAELHNLFGPTEASIDVTYWQCLPEHAGDPVVPIGRPIANTTCRILDHAGQQTPIGVPGELYLGGIGLARGYLGRPKLTREKFVKDPFSDGGRLYRTGDLARWRADGEIEFLGRNDDQVKIRGQRVEPGEIEAVLQADEMVKHAVVVADQDVLAAFVEPDFTAVTDQSLSSAPWLRRHVDQWQSLYEQIYTEPVIEVDADFNTAGWLSSYTGQPIPTGEMLEWRDRTVDRILGLQPKRVLEIGCGTGILLTRIAPKVSAYHGTDMSATAIDYVRGRLAEHGDEHVVLEKREAVDFAGIRPDSVDVVVLNSVTQYFPDVAYLVEVIRGAMEALVPGGAMFIGDVRNLRLLETLHASVQVAQAPGDVLAADVVQRVRHLARVENELLVDPGFFTRLREKVPELGRIEISPKEGSYDNELSRFRYDVVLEKAATPHVQVDARWLDWERGELTWDAVATMVRGGARELIALARVPNARVRRHHDRWQRLLGASGDATISEALAGTDGDAVDPEKLRALGRSCGYEVEISWAAGYPDGAFDVLLRRAGQPRADFRPPAAAEDLLEPANMPVRQELGADLRGRLLEKLAQKLPAHMVPSVLTVLDALPMTTSGKVDRKALRATRGAHLSEKPYVAPRDAVELRLARTWEKVLDVERVGVLDDFFELGGDSLVAIRLATEVQRAFDVKITLADQLAARTVEQEAGLVRGGGAAWRPLVEITAGEGTPVFCVHPAGGSVLCYGELARRLGRDRPFYGLAPLGLEEGQEADGSIGVMAERYLAEVRAVRPHGPYHLAGWSLGGVVALEMAARLEDEGERVELVAMIDSVAPELVDGDVDDVDVIAEFFAGVPLDLEHLRALTPDEAIRAAMEQAAAVNALPAGLDATRLLRMREVHKRHIVALVSHRAARYHGDVVLFRAADTPITQPAYGWENTVKGSLEIIGVPGNHQTVLSSPGVQRIARELGTRIPD
ncbi:non-ribosomal peptide synthetase [Amycolatopsis magusensis]|uniref:Amino acid adenylation domain-containing protein/non-ribosomal peptide synthase protein (TIGR01720 family) n=1 Tax=Amycolatopsis magusensis TaxID=882444 RepID=A0ABS4PR77_9PSEU|nr:non-ribosomal peptide synthetase [Amycolatopsis magusensis]MBP2181358.1 amino acid adenylation domain-containing protein/non-ribosomal peptide synthase protein (TIGR01720 family) [Amycolatopsis magusensis]